MSFQQGLSGLNSSSKSLDVIGNNIANASTYGTKSSRAEFSDMYANAIGGGGGGSNVGIGTMVQKVSQQFTQGNITTTDNPLDIAINGGGFFQLSSGNGPLEYSRNGQFKVDRSGYIVNNEGLKLMGYPANNLGVIQPGQASALQLPTGGIAPNMSTRIDMEVNLDSREGTTAPTAPDAAAIDFADATTYNRATSQTVYDAKGQNVSLTYYFQKAGTDQWNVFVTANGTPLAGTADAPLPVTTINFPTDGSAPITPADPVSIDIPTTVNAAGATTVAIPGVQLDLSGATQFGSGFSVTDLTQDGYAPGQLSSLVIDGSGVLTARYSNGQSKPAGQIEMATFRNVQGLQPVGGNNWMETFGSGNPVLGVPGDGNLGVLQAGALEESNVDLTNELVSMITAQRNYQANAQTIKTVDQVMQTLVNIR